MGKSPVECGIITLETFRHPCMRVRMIHSRNAVSRAILRTLDLFSRNVLRVIMPHSTRLLPIKSTYPKTLTPFNYYIYKLLKILLLQLTQGYDANCLFNSVLSLFTTGKPNYTGNDLRLQMVMAMAKNPGTYYVSSYV